MSKRFKIIVEYDGTNYAGWQRQKSSRTIQQAIEDALQPLGSGERVNVVGAGRTDAGVHALGQVAHFDLNTNLSVEKVRIVINSGTPPDINVKSCEEVDKKFHARFSAKKRTYIYKIIKNYSPFERIYSWKPHFEFDFNKLKICSDMILGRRNFERFCKSTCVVKNKECNVIESFWKDEGDFFIYTISANRFLQTMVRMLVGTMIEVARGRYTIEDFKNLLENKDNRVQVISAPARGLFLKEVVY